MNTILSTIPLSTDLKSIISSYHGDLSVGHVDADTVDVHDLSSVNLNCRNFVTNYTERPAYVNDMPYAASGIFGKKNTLDSVNLNCSIIYGEENQVSGNGTGNQMLVGGQQNVVQIGSTAFSVIGRGNVLSSKSNNTSVVGLNNQVVAQESFVAGRNNTFADWGKMCMVLGDGNTVDFGSGQTPECATVLGRKATCNHTGAFVWNGARATGAATEYKSHAAGSFNVNPQSGVEGFYIGDNNFVESVLIAVSKMTDSQKSQLRSLLGM